jgi:hypothetical protein
MTLSITSGALEDLEAWSTANAIVIVACRFHFDDH